MTYTVSGCGAAQVYNHKLSVAAGNNRLSSLGDCDYALGTTHYHRFVPETSVQFILICIVFAIFVRQMYAFPQ